MKTIAALTVGLALGVGGCGGSGGPTVANAPRYSEDEIVQKLGLEPDGYGSWETASGCYIAVVMNNSGTIDLYSDAGDTVVANGSKTAGVKIVNASPSCVSEVKQAIARIP